MVSFNFFAYSTAWYKWSGLYLFWPMILSSGTNRNIPNLFFIFLHLSKIYLTPLWLVQNVVIILSILDRDKSIFDYCDKNILNNVDKKHDKCIQIHLSYDYIYDLKVMKCIIHHISIQHSKKRNHRTGWWAESLWIPK